MRPGVEASGSVWTHGEGGLGLPDPAPEVWPQAPAQLAGSWPVDVRTSGRAPRGWERLAGTSRSVSGSPAESWAGGLPEAKGTGHLLPSHLWGVGGPEAPQSLSPELGFHPIARLETFHTPKALLQG